LLSKRRRKSKPQLYLGQWPSEIRKAKEIELAAVAAAGGNKRSIAARQLNIN
jgi:hypothetical protein